MRNHFLIRREDGIPLIGTNLFGIIDRGTNLLQVRPISGCPLNCIYCSVDEGPFSKKMNTYEVEPNYLASELFKVLDYKGIDDAEIHIDGIGEPLLYRSISELVYSIRKNPHVRLISMQTNGVLLNKTLVDSLKKSGLDRLNISVNSANRETAKLMSGTDWYDADKVWNMAEYAVKQGIDVIIAPVIVLGHNENDLDSIISKALSIGARLGIQKYERYKHGRRLKVKVQSWNDFYRMLRSLEKKHGAKLVLSKADFSIHKAKSLPIVFKKGESFSSKVVLPGWLSNEVIATARNRLISVFGSRNAIGDRIRARMVKTKHNIYIAEKI